MTHIYSQHELMKKCLNLGLPGFKSWLSCLLGVWGGLCFCSQVLGDRSRLVT